MNEEAINKLRKKFIIMQTLTLVTVMFLMSGFIYCFNLWITTNNVRNTMNFIIDNDGIIQDASIVFDDDTDLDYPDNPDFSYHYDTYDIVDYFQELFGIRKFNFEQEKYSFATRYFYISYDENGDISRIVKNHIGDISNDDTVNLGNIAQKAFLSFGRRGNYYYLRSTNDSGITSVVYLESTEPINQNRRLIFTALTLETLGILITLLIVTALSRRAIAPEIRAAELQKKFITDASHELKTPLAVIKANTEMEEIINGENEWTQSTLRQVDRLNGLIKKLVTIAKFREKERSEVTNVDISAVVKDAVETFSPVASCGKIELCTSVADEVHMMCAAEDIRQLTSLLVDNAIKYCDENGSVNVELSNKTRKIILKVSNSYAAGENVDYSKFFDRFYREDKSRNIDKGGYGIGLSIAQEIVNNYKGSIKVSWDNNIISFICCFNKSK